MGFLHPFHLCHLHVCLSRRPQGDLPIMADAKPSSLSISNAQSTGASIFLLYAFQTLPFWQGGKCLLQCLLVPSALCHHPRGCWASLARGSGESKPGGAVPRLWRGSEGEGTLGIPQALHSAFLSPSRDLPLDVLLAQLSSKQRGQLGPPTAKPDLGQCLFPIQASPGRG